MTRPRTTPLRLRDWKLWDEEHPWVKRLTAARRKRLADQAGKHQQPSLFDKGLHEDWESSLAQHFAPVKLPPVPVEKITANLHQAHTGAPAVDRSKEYEHRDLHKEGEWEPRTGSSRYGLITFDDAGNVLLRKPTNNYDGYHWTFPKGHPDSTSEHPLDAARRETLEETGHHPLIEGHVPGGFRGGNTGSANHFYLAHDHKGVVDPTIMSENGETAELRWASPKDALNMISQSTNPGGRYRDLQAYRAATEEYGKLHPELHFPTIKLPVPPKAARAPKGRLFKPTDARVVKPSYSPPPKARKFQTSSATSGQQNFLAAVKAQKIKKALKEAPQLGTGINYPEDPMRGKNNGWMSMSDPLDTRNWAVWNLEHPYEDKGRHYAPKEFDTKLKAKFAADKMTESTALTRKINVTSLKEGDHIMTSRGHEKVKSISRSGGKVHIVSDRDDGSQAAHHFQTSRSIHRLETPRATPADSLVAAKVTDAQVHHLAKSSGESVDVGVKKGIYSSAEAAALHTRISALEKSVVDERKSEARVKYLIKLAEIGAGIAIAFATGGLAVPVLIAIVATTAPALAAETSHYAIALKQHHKQTKELANTVEGRGNEALETRNWAKWHEEHPYIPHPRQKNESAKEYDHRLKTEYQAWLTDGGKRTAGELKPGDRLHYGNEDHRVASVAKRSDGKLMLTLNGETSGKEYKIKAGKTATAPHAKTVAPERRGYFPVGSVSPGEHVSAASQTQDSGQTEHTVLATHKHGGSGHSLTLEEAKTGDVHTTNVYDPGHMIHVVGNPAPTPKIEDAKVTLTEARRKQMFEGKKRDALTKAQERADKMPRGRGFYEARPMSDSEYADHRDHVAYEVERHGAADLENSPFSTAVSEDRVNGAMGAYTPERMRQQKVIIDEEMAKATKVPNEHRAIIMGGPGGAGKSTILRRNAVDPNSVAGKNGVKYAHYAEKDDLANHIHKGDGIGDPTNFVVLNPDNIKERMAQTGMIPTIDHLSPLEAAGPFAHNEASAITQQIADRLTKQGKNVIWDITLNSVKSGTSRTDSLRSTPGGYHIDAPFVNVKLTTSASNAEKRHRHGQDDFNMGKGLGGRFVPSGLILGASDKEGKYDSENRAAFEKLKTAGVFDHTMTIDNEGYAGTLLDETGHPATPEELHLAQRSDPSTPQGPQSNTMNVINSYVGDHLSFQTLKQLLAHKTYADPSWLGRDGMTTNNSEDINFAEPGTWGEVTKANSQGLLSDDEYEAIHDAMCQAHGAVRTPPIPLSGDQSDIGDIRAADDALAALMKRRAAR